uniref:NADH dehydrogenase subunit 3 n=1 Tax=Callirhopalus sedakowii TaxID=2919454 RepID=UPI00207A2525|nr:NADH dehydrogenase subunit 3 [Callirhopalus sedakowii]URN73819.1 NADH dehydrogenase subunit 3 [Callirhopalus sedakowii]
MKIMFFMSEIIWLIMMILLLILNISSKKTFSDQEKNSPFECGFDPKNSARMPFSLQFFLIAVIFIIFDVELTLLLPMVLAMKTSNFFYYSITMVIFVLILLISLFHEWSQGALDWTK